MYALLATLPKSFSLPLPPIAHWRRIRRERQQLAELSDRMLHDIGLTPAQARREAARPFWDAPLR